MSSLVTFYLAVLINHYLDIITTERVQIFRMASFVPLKYNYDFNPWLTLIDWGRSFRPWRWGEKGFGLINQVDYWMGGHWETEQKRGRVCRLLEKEVRGQRSTGRNWCCRSGSGVRSWRTGLRKSSPSQLERWTPPLAVDRSFIPRSKG